MSATTDRAAILASTTTTDELRTALTQLGVQTGTSGDPAMLYAAASGALAAMDILSQRKEA